MYLERLELVDFRSYGHVALNLRPGIAVLVGPNAQGKTNLLEAIHYLGIGGSHRVSGDAPLVRSGAGASVIRGVAHLTGDPEARGRSLTVELELRPGGRNRMRVNGQATGRTADAIGLVRSVLLAPEDLQLVRGDPAERRRFLDEVLAQRRPAFLKTRQEYDRVLRQRNALLRVARGGATEQASLGTWTDALARTGATLLAARLALIHALAGPADAAYRDLVATSPQRGSGGALSLGYQLSTGRLVIAEAGVGIPDPAALAEELRQGLGEVEAAERDRGMTLAGPHRDDLEFTLNGLPAKGYASHGELWSLVLALRLASREVLHEVGEEPIVLLDDVFAELDETRRTRLGQRCTSFEQVLVTAAVDADVPVVGPRYRVRAGAVEPPVSRHGHAGSQTP